MVKNLSESKYISRNIKDTFSLTDITVLDKIIEITSKKKVKCYLVGGAVRDIILGKTPKDLDFVVERKADIIAKELAIETNGEVLNNSEFGTSKLSIDKSIFDIANSRSETYAHPGALPDITQNSIDKDLWRRDFSINSMALALSPDEEWQILDPTDGLLDVAKGIIRILHDKSFVDDPTRIFRAVKYAVRFGFAIEEHTMNLIETCIKSNHINQISGHRILSELSQITEEENYIATTKLLSSLRILSSIHSKLEISDALLDRLNKLKTLPILGTSKLLNLLLSDINTENINSICSRLDLSPKTKQILYDIQTIKQSSKSLSCHNILNSELMVILDKLDVESVGCMQIISKSKSLRENLSKFLEKLRFIQPKIEPQQIISLGISPGPQIGILLADIRFAVADGILKTEAEEIQFISDKIQ